jgi:hypothetical protein
MPLPAGAVPPQAAPVRGVAAIIFHARTLPVAQTSQTWRRTGICGGCFD